MAGRHAKVRQHVKLQRTLGIGPNRYSHSLSLSRAVNITRKGQLPTDCHFDGHYMQKSRLAGPIGLLPPPVQEENFGESCIDFYRPNIMHVTQQLCQTTAGKTAMTPTSGLALLPLSITKHALKGALFLLCWVSNNSSNKRKKSQKYI